MNKDVIYIDTEDDITGIIGKVKQAGAKIVALVPPKRAGVLQSVVNLKLLQKAAQSNDKRVVLITSDHSLTALASGISMPVAKNLQSRPEVPDIKRPESTEDEVINGAELPVGEVAGAMGGAAAASAGRPSVADQMSQHVDLHDAGPAAEAATATPAAAPAKPKQPKKPLLLLGRKAGGKMNIPDFSKFRNKFFLFGGIGVVVVVFLIWALVIAPHAQVTISAQTTAVNIDKTLTLDPKVASSDATNLNLKPNVQQLKKSVATQFTATGTKDIGNKATGSIHITNCDSSSSFGLAAGTTFTAPDGHRYLSNNDATVSGFTGSASACHNSGVGAGGADVAVTAADLGPDYNIAPTTFTISGIDPASFISASSSAPMSGGSHQQATVVSQDDVDKAKQQLSQPNATDAKNQLKKQFQGDYIIIDESFTTDQGSPTVDPAVGQPAQQAKLTIETTYTIIGLPRTDVKSVLTNTVNDALKSKSGQQVYSLGDNSIQFQSFQKQDGGAYTARMVTTGFIGPKIDTASLAKQITGKRFGEIQSIVNQIPGVDKVDVTMSPFWVTTAPSPNKIDISFSVANGK